MFLLFAYFATTLLIAVHLSWHMAFGRDEFDWRYSDVSLSSWLYVALWPLLLLKPRSFIRLQVFDKGGAMDIAARERELDGLRKNPPSCSARICYRQVLSGCGVFQFSSAAVAEILGCGNRPLAGHIRDVLRWVAHQE